MDDGKDGIPLVAGWVIEDGRWIRMVLGKKSGVREVKRLSC
jgi:hypothetical protein